MKCCCEFGSQTRIRNHRDRMRVRPRDCVEFRRLADLGYRFEVSDAYPKMYPHKVVAAGGRCWTLADEPQLINVRLEPTPVDVSGRLRTLVDGSPGRIRNRTQVHDAQGAIGSLLRVYPQRYPTTRLIGISILVRENNRSCGFTIRPADHPFR
jgi:hypothetical protein